VRFVLLLLAAAACSGDANVIDAPASPQDASDGGVATDAADAGTACAACGPDQICVAYHDGTCSPNIQIECQDRNPGCQGTTCVQGAACEFWHCKRGQDAGSPYICYSCPNDITGALNCHGP